MHWLSPIPFFFCLQFIIKQAKPRPFGLQHGLCWLHNCLHYLHMLGAGSRGWIGLNLSPYSRILIDVVVFHQEALISGCLSFCDISDHWCEGGAEHTMSTRTMKIIMLVTKNWSAVHYQHAQQPEPLSTTLLPSGVGPIPQDLPYLRLWGSSVSDISLPPSSVHTRWYYPELLPVGCLLSSANVLVLIGVFSVCFNMGRWRVSTTMPPSFPSFQNPSCSSQFGWFSDV